MTRTDLVLAKGASVRGRLERVRDALSVGRDTFAGHVSRIEQASFNVFLAMQECSDIGSHIVGDERWEAPATLGGIFDVLHAHGVITSDTAAAMRRGTKLRNLIAHAYAVIDPGKLFDSSSAGIGEIERFLAEVEAWLPA